MAAEHIQMFFGEWVLQYGRAKAFYTQISVSIFNVYYTVESGKLVVPGPYICNIIEGKLVLKLIWITLSG